MKKTQHAYLQTSDQQRGLPQPPPVRRPDEIMPRIELPPPEAAGVGPLDFQALVTNRSSLRTYAKTPISLAELSFLLWCTQGVKELYQGSVTMRTVPSAGARHAFETLLSVHRIEGLAAGLYHYDAVNHQLAAADTVAGLDGKIAQACYGQRFLQTSAVTFLWVAIPHRMTWRYGERGYRYLHLDAGHVGQNLYLAAEAISAGACTVAAFDDEALNRLLNLDGQDEFVIYLAAVGKKPSR